MNLINCLIRISTVYWILIMMVEARPGLTTKKHKRQVHLVQVRREEYEDSDYDHPIHGPQDGESKTKAMKELLNILGLKAPGNLDHYAAREKAKKPPKYMVDLYNAVADNNGITRSPDLLDADTVRSIPNTDPRAPRFCRFNLNALNDKETILDAELHLFQSRKLLHNLKQPLMQLHSSHRLLPASQPKTYIIKIYQLLSSYNTTSNPIKKLVAARRLNSYHGGWHIFPILTTVESWISGQAENFGIYTEILTESGKIVENKLERNNLQPILILFTNNNKSSLLEQKNEPDIMNKNEASTQENTTSHHSKSDQETEASTSGKREKRSTGGHDRQRSSSANKSRRKKNRSQGQTESSNDRKNDKQKDKLPDPNPIIVQRTRGRYYSTGQRFVNEEVYGGYAESDVFDYDDYTTGTSHREVYEYASDGDISPDDSGKELSASSNGRRRDQYTSFPSMATSSASQQSCRRYPLYVDFEEMGWSGWIIHPQGYNAYHCQGKCSFPLGQHLNPSNHATVQSIMHTLGLGNQPVEMPCCAPDKLYDINLLYFDQNDYVVLRRYKNMVAASCACR